ncbi:MAG: PD-(D/E)XK nuclease family protein [Anaerovoracaceae bacterium]|jgi:ATP-dependent helicase/nuclease subunit B
MGKMLNIYCGRESVNKEAFMFERIRGSMDNPGEDRRIVILVPDQYTLQAERNALEYLEAPGLMDLEILSPGRLANRVLKEAGGITRVRIDKRGRHMVLRGILEEEKDQLKAFRGLEGSHGFIDMLNNLISELKQFNTCSKDILPVMKEVESDSILWDKLKDIQHIFSQYEKRTENVYLDSEDYLDLFTSRIKDSITIRKTVFWVSGFLTFTPKTLKMIGQLLKYGREVNVILTGDMKALKDRDGDLFLITQKVMEDLAGIAAEMGIGHQYHNIDHPSWNPSKPEAIVHLEKELYSYPAHIFSEEQGIKLCMAANFYGEAETAAAEILSLVRDKGYRFRQIGVICNDMETRGPIANRIFHEYGIPVFSDVKRGVLHNPVVALIISLLDILAGNWLYEDVFAAIKTGLLPVETFRWEDLENYAIKYKIQGSRWKKPFKYGISNGDEGNGQNLDETRQMLVHILVPFERDFKEAETVREKTEILYHFLNDVLKIPEEIERIQWELYDKGRYEWADEMGQIWGVSVDLFDQLVELSGKEEMGVKEYASMLRAGFEAVEVGVIPPSSDQVIMGTMQRTRVGRLKALFVLAANDGILPAQGNQGLLSDDERKLLLGLERNICEDGNNMAREEQLAIYKNLSAPEELLWMGCSQEDIEGGEIQPSMIFDKIREVFPNSPLEKDILNRDDPLWLINGEGSTLKYLTAALQRVIGEGEPLCEPWKVVANWYRDRGSNSFEMVKKGLFFKVAEEGVKKEWIKDLFGGVCSPSRLERFSRCPFSHLVQYGFRPDERRVFEVAGREVGDVYHECIMILSEQLTRKDVGINDVESPWMTITKGECLLKVDHIIDEIAVKYRDGMLLSGEEEIYRMGRMKDVCGEAAWALIQHVRQGRIKEMFFEERFGQGFGQSFPPVLVNIGDEAVRIEGKIDRVDLLPEGYVKIIDYKSGSENFRVGEAKGGWRLQLMIYLKAMMEGMGSKGQQVKPAGVFYFEIAEPLIDAAGISEGELAGKVEQELRKSFKLNGILLDDPKVIEGIAGDFSDFSEILPLRRNKDGVTTETGKGRLLSEEQFKELCDAVDQTMERLCRSLAGGMAVARPKRTKYENACMYCQYKSICNFDVAFEGCVYEIVE